MQTKCVDGAMNIVKYAQIEVWDPSNEESAVVYTHTNPQSPPFPYFSFSCHYLLDTSHGTLVCNISTT